LEKSGDRFNHGQKTVCFAGLRRMKKILSGVFLFLTIIARASDFGKKNEKPFHTSLGIDFVLIPAGSFMMGLSPEELLHSRYTNALPKHPVRVSRPFYMSRHEITQRQWRVVMGENPSHFKGKDRPVENITWHQVQEFIRRLNLRDHTRSYRLPTEAEWEYACRAGSVTQFCFGDDREKLDRYGWYCRNSDFETHPVGKLRPNDWGLYDMHGNAAEWCQDWYEGYPRTGVFRSDPSGPASGTEKIIRGGAWDQAASFCRSAARSRNVTNDGSVLVGFRLAKDAAEN
jgi:formylglycine-generating enzyme required for sulfatase activity